MKNNYICNCKHFDYSKKKFKYWEDKKVTSDELLILEFIQHNIKLDNKNILHIGIGNSFIYEKLKKHCKIYGITISNNEINKALLYKDKNYKVFYCDKISSKLMDIFNTNMFDLIIDNNLKSYACCQNSFNFMFENFIKLLRRDGSIVTSRNGMNWVKDLKPKLAFNFQNFFHYKLKESEGKKNNMFKIEEAKQLSKKFSLNLYSDENILIFKKINEIYSF